MEEYVYNMRLKTYIIISLVLVFTLSCERKETVSPIDTCDTNPFKCAIVSLQKSNLYYFHYYNVTNEALQDWFGYEEIIGDTTVNKVTYCVIDNLRMERADKEKAYIYSNGEETIKLDFNIKVGDAIKFFNKNVRVDSIQVEKVFWENREVIYVSNEYLYPDTLISGMYTSFVGILKYSEKTKNNTYGYSLKGAAVEGLGYGDLGSN